MILISLVQGRQGIVKQIYRGTIFLYDENEEQNGGYFCSKSQMCEKVKLFDSFTEKVLSSQRCSYLHFVVQYCHHDLHFLPQGGKSGTSGFEDFMSSPKSPLSPKKPWQARENSDCMYLSV